MRPTLSPGSPFPETLLTGRLPRGVHTLPPKGPPELAGEGRTNHHVEDMHPGRWQEWRPGTALSPFDAKSFWPLASICTHNFMQRVGGVQFEQAAWG